MVFFSYKTRDDLLSDFYLDVIGSALFTVS